MPQFSPESSRSTTATRRTSSQFLSCLSVLLASRLCGAFLPPLAARRPAFNRNHHSAVSSFAGPVRHGNDVRVRSAPKKRTVCCMQQGSEEDILQTAVKTLAEQVEDLTAMVKQLADDTVSGSSQVINGAAVENNAAIPVGSPSSSAGKEKSKELVSTSAAQQRINAWLQEQGLPSSTMEASPTPAAPVSPPVAAVAVTAPVEVAPVEVAPAVTPPAEDAPAEGGYKIKFEWDDAIHEINCDAETTILEAAMDAGFELPSSCMSGSCLTCPGKLKSGKVDQSEGVLEEEQTEAGYMLTCVSYPLSDVEFAVIEEDELP